MKTWLTSLLALLLCGAMLVCLSACDGTSKRASDDDEEDEESVSDTAKEDDENEADTGEEPATSDKETAATIPDKAAKRVIEWYFDAMGFYDYDAFDNLMPTETIVYIENELNTTLREFVDNISEGADVPEDANIEFEITGSQALSEDEVEALKENMKDCAIDLDKISRATRFSVDVTATADGETNETEFELTLFAYDEHDGMYQIFEEEIIVNVVKHIKENM